MKNKKIHRKGAKWQRKRAAKQIPWGRVTPLFTNIFFAKPLLLCAFAVGARYFFTASERFSVLEISIPLVPFSPSFGHRQLQ
ncbi:MAG: hypothetical protein ACOYNV_09800 [Propionivibrio sp.]